MNLGKFEAKDLIWIEVNVNNKTLLKLPRELILSLESKEFLEKMYLL